MSELKPVNSLLMCVAETPDYKKVLARCMSGSIKCAPLERQDLQLLNLYQVVQPDGSIYYVLAESPDGAISQSTAGKDRTFTSFEVRQQFYDSCRAIQLPLIIRGWSNNKF